MDDTLEPRGAGVALGDIGAQVSAATIGCNKVFAYMDHLLDYAERRTRVQSAAPTSSSTIAPLSTYDRGEPIRLLPTDCHATNEQKEDAHDRHSNR